MAGRSKSCVPIFPSDKDETTDSEASPSRKEASPEARRRRNTFIKKPATSFVLNAPMMPMIMTQIINPIIEDVEDSSGLS